MTRSLLPFVFGIEKRGPLSLQPHHGEVNEVFDEFRGAIVRYGNKNDVSETGLLTPKIDVSETDEIIEVVAEIPGVRETDIDISIANNILVIKGVKLEEHEEKKNYHLVERSHGRYVRSISLGFNVKPDDVKADLDAGTLKITITKPAEEANKISINKAT